ncbi:MAG: Smr/MutS family protein [Gammaproteobacteria bacterium]
MGSDDNDIDAFRRAVADAKPLKHDRVHFERDRPDPRARFTREEQHAVLDEAMHGNPDPTLLGTGEELFFARTGLSRTVLKKLKRGQYALNAEIDLHGLTTEQAREALREFLVECAWHRHNCVRVITGKGKGSGHRGPVLKPRVARWLRKHEDVYAFSTARPNDGGSGALYVLLDYA